MKNSDPHAKAARAERRGRGIGAVLAAALAAGALIRPALPARQVPPDLVCKKVAGKWVVAAASTPEPDGTGCPPRLLYLMGSRFDLNRAEVIDLERLPGLGPETARRVVGARERAGGFLEFPASLPGVSRKAMESLRQGTEVRAVESGDE